MSEMQRMLAEAADRVFRDRCDAPLHRAVERGEWPGELWRLLEDTGFTRALASEAAGGAGLSFTDGAALIRLAGWHALPLPLVETMLAHRLLEVAGIDAPAGALTIAAVREPHRGTVRSVAGRAAISAILPKVPWGRHADAVAVAISTEDGDRVVLVDRGAARVEHGVNVAGEPRDTLHFENAPVRGLGDAAVSAADVHGLCAVARSLQMAGGCARALELAAEYANLRVQFGRPIAKFQIIQQYVATMATQAAAAAGAADLGVSAVERDHDPFGIACAKVRSGDAAGAVAATAHQVFGAIGFTREHSLHLVTRRLYSWRDEFGSEHEWSTGLGRAMFEQGGSRLWPRISA